MNYDPGEKYRDKVTPQHKMAMEAIGMMRMMLGAHREQFDTLIEAEQNMHSFGGVIDPTLYRDMIYSKSFKQQMRMVKAAVAFLKELDAVAAELETSNRGAGVETKTDAT